MSCPAQPGLLAFRYPLSQKWKARPLLTFSVNRDKEEGSGRVHLQNGEQVGLANGSGKREKRVCLFSGETGRTQLQNRGGE